MLSRSALRVSRSAASSSRLPSSSITSAARLQPLLAQSSGFAALRHASSLSTRTAWTGAPSIAARRWYSDAPETKSEAKPAEAEKKDAGADVEGLKKDIEAKNKEILELKDKYLRSIADYRNLQDRTKREAQSARDFALQKFAQDLVSSIDTFEAALTSIPEAKLKADPASGAEDMQPSALHKDLLSLHEGLKLTEQVLLGTLKKHGIERFDPAEANEKFDPNMHEATFQAPMAGKEEGTVFHTQRKGFLLNGRVLRAAQVGIVKNQ